MSDHTQGLWRWADYSLYNGDDTDIAIIGPDDGERIVQCVNSMAGIDDPESLMSLIHEVLENHEDTGHLTNYALFMTYLRDIVNEQKDQS